MITGDLKCRESKPVRVKIEEHAIRRFAEAAGIQFNHKVPPTFAGSFVRDIIDGVSLIPPGAIHCEQNFTYYQPVSIGDWITYTHRINDVSEQVGKLGKVTVLEIETIGCNPTGERIFKVTSTTKFPSEGKGYETYLGLSDK